MRAIECGNELRVYDAYLFKESLKEIQGRYYDPDDKAWCIPKSAENITLLQMLGCELEGALSVQVQSITKAPRIEEKPIMDMPIRASPFVHQVQAYNFALKLIEQGKKGIALFCEMGTGKTLVSIALAGTLYNQEKIKKLLIVAPLSIVDVWRGEFEKFAAFDYQLAVLEGDSIKKADVIRNMRGKGLQVVVVNYESCWRLEDNLLLWEPDMIVCDESTKIKNPNAKCSRALHRLGKKSRYNAILSGTPVVNNPTDLFSQYKFLDESIFGTSYYSFRAKYAILGGYQSKQIVGYKNLPELVSKAHAVAYRVRLVDAVDLPPYIDEVRTITLEEKALSLYKSIERDSYAKLMQGDISITNILTKLLRLSQVTGGYIRDDENGIVQQVSKAKLNALEDIIAACVEEGKKVVVFVRFIPEIEAIERLMQSMKIKYALIKGDVKDRAEQVKRFQEEEVKVFIGQLQTVSMGLTLTAASVAVFYSLDFNYANYEQSRARIHRIGQDKRCLYIHLVAKGTIDEKIMHALQHKGDVAKMIVDNYKQVYQGGASWENKNCLA